MIDALVLAAALTLREAVDEALARHPAIAAAGARREVAAAHETEARAMRLPRVEVSETVVHSNNPVFVFGSLLEQGEFAPKHFDPAFLNAPEAMTNFRTSLAARYAVFDRYRVSTAIGQSRHAVNRAGLELEETRQRIRAETIARYYGVRVAQEKLAVAREAVLSAEADAKAARDRFEQGLVVESDALSAEVQLAAFRQRVIAAEGELAVARAGLGIVVGRDVDVDAAIPERPLEAAALLDDAIARAMGSRAPVVKADTFIKDAEARLRAERSTALPRVDAFGNVSASNFDGDYAAGVAITLDVFDRGRPARVAAARAEIDAARAGEALARDAVTMEVVGAWHRLRAARESAAVAAGAVARAEAAVRIIRDRYEQGLTTITEPLRAQTALVSARFELLAARYESIVAHAELLRSTGELNDLEAF